MRADLGCALASKRCVVGAPMGENLLKARQGGILERKKVQAERRVGEEAYPWQQRAGTELV